MAKLSMTMRIFTILLLAFNIYIKSTVSHSLPIYLRYTNERLNRSIRAASSNSKSCQVPFPTGDRTITYTCFSQNAPGKCNTRSGYVPNIALATIKCAKNYYLENEVESNSMTSLCSDKKWTPPIGKCFKICKKLKPVNIEFHCRRNRNDINCDENSVMLAGTKIEPKCKKWYKYAQSPHYLEITCDENGNWDYPLYTCIPECGQRFLNAQPLIANGVEENFGDSPWHVAIYDENKNLICGGTIISLSLVISAAHCFKKTAENKTAEDFEVVVSKFTSNYYQKDNKNQKAFKIKNIRYSEKEYSGQDGRYENDVVILILQGTLTIGPTVMPACLDWMGLKRGKYPAENELGKVVGWGMDELGHQLTETLRTADLPFMSQARCRKSVPKDFRKYITYDKFCAGNASGPSVQKGDSGGGLLFKQNDFYYLRGIVSIRQYTVSPLAAFTDLKEHILWISDVRKEVENDIMKITEIVQHVRLEMQTSARNDPVKLSQLSDYLKKEVINRQTVIDDLKLEAQTLLESLTKAILNATVKAISEALLTNSLSKTHQLSDDILKKRNYTMYFNIMDAAVESILNKTSVNELLPMISRDNEICCIEELLSIYLSIFKRLQRNGEIENDSGVKLADRFRQAIEASKNKKIDSQIKSIVDQIKGSFPEWSKVDVFVNSTPTPTTQSSDSDIEVFVDSPPSPTNVCIKNIAHSQHLIIFEPTAVNEKRSNKPSPWIFEADGEYVYIKHKQSQKYMLANFQEKYKKSERTALTFKLADKMYHNSKWKIIECPSGLSRISPY